MSTRRLLTVVLLVSALGRCTGSVRGADAGQPRFIAPTNQQELDARVAELRQHYGPFLRCNGGIGVAAGHVARHVVAQLTDRVIEVEPRTAMS